MRATHPIFIAAAECWLPIAIETPQRAIEAGRLTADAARSNGYAAVPVSEDLAPPEMAAMAAAKALSDAAVPASDVDMLAHAWLYHQGHEFWSPAHFVADTIGSAQAVAFGVQQMCNGGAMGIELCATRLLSDPDCTVGVVTTADRFAPPGFDRWAGDYGIAYGDGATALVLTCNPGRFRLRAWATSCAPELEVMHRGDDPFTMAAGQLSVDARRTKKAFLSAGGGERFSQAVPAHVAPLVERSLRDAGMDAGDRRIRLVAPPRLGAGVLADAYRPALRAVLGSSVDLSWNPGRQTGHLGAGDAAANLAELATAGGLAPGEVAILLSAGGGFSWSCLVVEAR